MRQLFSIDAIAGPHAGASLRIRNDDMAVIGRNSSADFTIDDPLISGHHSLVAIVSDGEGVRCFVQDLGSTNGTELLTLAGTILPVPRKTTRWSFHDILRIGDHLLQIRAVDQERAATTALGNDQLLVHLAPPRPHPSPPPAVDDPPKAPEPPTPRSIPWISMLTSAMGGLVIAAVLRRAIFLVFSVLAPAAMFLQYLWDKRKNRKKHEMALAEHRRLLVGHEREVAARSQLLAVHKRLFATDPAHQLRVVNDPHATLWLRRPGREGDWELTVGYQWHSSAALPVNVNLSAGPIGVFGEPAHVESLGRWLAAQVVSTFPPGYLRVSTVWNELAGVPHNHSEATESLAIVRSVLGQELPDASFIIALANQRSELPDECAHVIEIKEDGQAVWEHLSKHRVTLIDLMMGVSSAILTQFAEPLKFLRDNQTMPRTPPRLIDLLDNPTVETLSKTWAASPPAAVQIPLGVNESQEAVNVDLNADGPHALVAGTTGAGKSVLLRTLVMGLAMRHHPEHLAIVLVDYKGGAAFRACAQLPHIVDILTDLDESATQRALESLRAEMRRREQILADHDFSDHRQLLTAGLAPLAPRLLIVVDELRALTEDLPDLIPELVQIAALGRSLGVHLVLATQRPGGTVDADMRANINLRLALRVQSSSDSHDILELPDAASLPASRPGAALVRAGQGDARGVQVAGIMDDAATTLAATAQGAARAIGARSPRRPWLEPLPRKFSSFPAYLRDITGLDPSQSERSVYAGIRDLPAEQYQDFLQFKPDAGHLLITGGPMSGRTSSLRTVAQGFPGAVHVIADSPHKIIDSRDPRLGTAAGIDDIRLISRLWQNLTALEVRTDSRRQLLVVDDADALIDQEDARRSMRFKLLEFLRRSSAAQVTVVAAGGRGMLTPRIASAFNQRWILNWPDETGRTLAGVPRDAHIPSGPGGALEINSQGSTPARLKWCAEPDAAATFTAEDLPAHPVDPVRLYPLPRLVTFESVQSPAVGGDLATALDIPLRSMIVCGPAGSGRTNVLNVLDYQCQKAERKVLRPEMGDISVDDLGDILGAVDAIRSDSPVVILDDVDLLEGWNPQARWVGSCTNYLQAGGIVIASSATASVPSAFRGLLATLRRHRRGIILDAGAPLSTEVFGVNVTKVADPAGAMPGRGVWVDGSRVTPLQMALMSRSLLSPPAV